MPQADNAMQTDCSSYRENGYLVLQHQELPFSRAEWNSLTALALDDSRRFEIVTSGDTTEPTDVLVHRILRDGDPPQADDPELAKAVLGIVGSPERLAFYERVLGEEDLMIRRAQAHILGTAGFIGRHRDSESSPHYLAAVVLQLRPAGSGGAFAVYGVDDQPKVIDRFAMLMTDAELPHEVLPVQSGQRSSLAFWLAKRPAP